MTKGIKMATLNITKITSDPSFKNTTLLWKSDVKKIESSQYTHVRALEQDGTVIHDAVPVKVYRDILKQGDYSLAKTRNNNKEFLVIAKKSVTSRISSFQYIDETDVTYDLKEVNSEYRITRNGKTISTLLRKKHKTKLQAETYLKNVLKAKPI
jgi:hypothetical protein